MEFEKYIDIRAHKDKIVEDTQEIGNKYAPKVNTFDYLKALVAYFLSNLDDIGKDFYKNTLREKNKSFYALQFTDLLNSTFDHFYKIYSSIFNDYNSGNMYGEYINFSREKDKFENRVKKKIDELIKEYSENYRAEKNSRRTKKWKKIWAMISGIGSLGGLANLIEKISHIKFFSIHF